MLTFRFTTEIDSPRTLAEVRDACATMASHPMLDTPEYQRQLIAGLSALQAFQRTSPKASKRTYRAILDTLEQSAGPETRATIDTQATENARNYFTIYAKQRDELLTATKDEISAKLTDFTDAPANFYSLPGIYVAARRYAMQDALKARS